MLFITERQSVKEKRNTLNSNREEDDLETTPLSFQGIQSSSSLIIIKKETYNNRLRLELDFGIFLRLRSFMKK